MRTPRGYAKKLEVLIEHGGEFGLFGLAKKPDGELSRILGPGRLMMKQIRDELLRISAPPAKHLRKSPETVEAGARRLLERTGLKPSIFKQSYPRRLAQLLRIGVVYGLQALEDATDKQIQEVFGIGVLTERQRELKIIQFLTTPTAATDQSASDDELVQFLLGNESASKPPERQLRVPKARPLKPTDKSKEKSSPANYGWQEKALQAWLKNGRRGVVEAATGSGKTRVGIRIASEFVKQGGCVLIVTPTRDLVEQWITEAEDTQIKVWADSDAELLLQSGTPGIAVATYARAGTAKFLSAAKAGRRKPQLLVADEAHHLGSDVQGKHILSHTWHASLGLTATLERSDGAVEEINEKIGAVVYRYSVKQAVKDGVLAAFHYVTLGVELEDEIRAEYEEIDAKVRSWAGKLLGEVGVASIPKNFMKFAQEQKKLGVFSASMYVSFWNKRRNLVAGSRAKLLALKKARLETTGVHLLSFAETEPAAQAAAEALTVEPHYIVEFISGSLSKSRRRQLRDAFSDETLSGLVGPKLLDEGINLPEADLGIVLAKSSSNVQLIQRLGRVLRRKKSRRDAVFLTLFARGTYEDPYTKVRSEDKDLRLKEVIEASIEGRPIKLTDSPSDTRELRKLLTG
jgi:superfamily II DNA or RNA helicase